MKKLPTLGTLAAILPISMLVPPPIMVTLPSSALGELLPVVMVALCRSILPLPVPPKAMIVMSGAGLFGPAEIVVMFPRLTLPPVADGPVTVVPDGKAAENTAPAIIVMCPGVAPPAVDIVVRGGGGGSPIGGIISGG